MTEFIINSEQLERMIEAIEHDTSREVNRVIIEGERVPEIVRCRDCKYYDPHCTDDGVCFLPDGDGDFARWEVKPDGFCAWGERKVDA